jgi:hypothetical protein
MGYGYTEAERQRRISDWQHAAKACPHCSAPINQQKFGPSGNDEPRCHCGATACRSAAYRQRKADRLSAARQEADAHINRYIAQLPADQAAAVRAMRDVLMSYEQADYQQGHEQALAIIKVIEAQRCKHDRISVLLDNASTAKRRADEAERYNRELQAIYQHRIAELQSELSVYQLLEGAVHNIATRQLAQQPDPQERPAQQEPEDEDRRAVRATLASIGVKPVEQALAEGEGDEYEDDTENDEGEEE